MRATLIILMIVRSYLLGNAQSLPFIMKEGSNKKVTYDTVGHIEVMVKGIMADSAFTLTTTDGATHHVYRFKTNKGPWFLAAWPDNQSTPPLGKQNLAYLTEIVGITKQERLIIVPKKPKSL
jgi:hypothetical protein